MKVKYLTIDMQITPRKVVSRDVMAHEVTLAIAKYGESSIKLSDRQVVASREIDDMQQEFDRLRGAWGQVSNDKDSVTWVESVFGNPRAGGLEHLEKAMSRDAGSLFPNLEHIPAKPVAQTNDQATSKIFERSAKTLESKSDKPVMLKTAEMRDALTELEIDFDESMKSKELLAFGTAALNAKAGELGLEVDELGTADIYNAIVEAE